MIYYRSNRKLTITLTVVTTVTYISDSLCNFYTLGLSLKYVWPTQIIPREQASSSTLSNFQLPRAPQLRLGFWDHPFSPFMLHLSGLSLGRFCPTNCCEAECVTSVLCLEKCCFFVVIQHSGSYKVSGSFSATISKSRGYDSDTSFKTEHSVVSYSMHLDQLWVSVNQHLL